MRANGWIISIDTGAVLKEGRITSLQEILAAPEPEPEPIGPEVFHHTWAEVEPYLDQLPAIEADALELWLHYHKSQDEIATVLGMSQAGIHYMLHRCAQRVDYLVRKPRLTSSEVRDIIQKHLVPFEVDCLCAIWDYGNQLVVANYLGSSQGRVSHSVTTAIRKLRSINIPDVVTVYTFFQRVSDKKQWSLLTRQLNYNSRKHVPTGKVEVIDLTGTQQLNRR
jgi:hypothetical protein